MLVGLQFGSEMTPEGHVIRFCPSRSRGLQALGLCLCKDSGTAVLSCLSLGCHLRTPLLCGVTCLKAVKLTDQKTVNLKYSQPSVPQHQTQTQPTTTVSPNKPFRTTSLPCQVCVRRMQGPGSQHHPGQSPSKSLELNHCTEPAVRCQLTASLWKCTAHVGVLARYIPAQFCRASQYSA